MVVVEPAAGTSEDTNAARQIYAEDLAPLLEERGRATDVPADGNVSTSDVAPPEGRKTGYTGCTL